MQLLHLRRLLYPRIKYWEILALLSASVFLHAFFVWQQPFTNDEGAYLYDARTLLRGALPAGDVLTKSPVPVALFAVGEFFTSRSLFAARVVNVCATLLAVIPLYFLLRVLGGRRAVMLGILLWLLGSGTIIFHTIGHTQAIASLFAITSLTLFVTGMQQRTGNTRHILLAGICFVLAYASRKTAIALLPSLAVIWIMSSVPGMRVWRWFLGGVLLAVIPWMAWMYALYGSPGVWHALGGGYGDIVLKTQSITPWAGSVARMTREAVRMGGVYVLLLTLTCIVFVRDIIRRTVSEPLLIGSTWVATLVVLYTFWPTHLVEYLADFIPSIVISGSLTLAMVRMKRWQWYGALLLGICISLGSLYSVYVRPWTGMFRRDAVYASAHWLQAYVPKSDEVFTAAVIIPYLSGHHVPFNLSHPQWYGYSFISDGDKDTFLPPYAQVQEKVRQDVRWVLHEQLTSYVYPHLDFSGFRELLLIPNDTQYRQNPIRVYFRV